MLASFQCLYVSSCAYTHFLQRKQCFGCWKRYWSYLSKALDTSKLRHTHAHSHLFDSLGRPSSDWENIEVAAVKVGSRHGSVIPVLAENPNHPEEQSAVVMCGQSLKTNLSIPAPTCAPRTNTGLSRAQDRQTGRQRRRQTGSQERDLRAPTGVSGGVKKMLPQSAAHCRNRSYCSQSHEAAFTNQSQITQRLLSGNKYLEAE